MWTPLFAEGEVSGWAGLIGSVVNVGFAAAVGWYLLSKALPEMQQKNDEAQKEQRKDFRDGIKDQRDEFKATLAAMEVAAGRREERGIQEAKHSLDAVLKHCQDENDRRDIHMIARDEAMRKELSLLNETVRELTTLIEERIK